jgi:hypothetical protein
MTASKVNVVYGVSSVRRNAGVRIGSTKNCCPDLAGDASEKREKRFFEASITG